MKTFFLYSLLMICCCSCVVDILRELPLCTAEIISGHAIYPGDSVLIPEVLRNPNDQITICTEPQHGHVRFHGRGQISYHPDISSGTDSLVVKMIRVTGNDTTILESRQVIDIFENPESRCLSQLFEAPQTLNKRIFVLGRTIPETPFNPVYDPCFGFIRSIEILEHPEAGEARIQYASTDEPVLIYSDETPTSGTIDKIRYKICVEIDQEITCREFELIIQVII